MVAAVAGTAARFPIIVLALVLAITAALAVFTVRNVSIDTDATEMLSPNLAFRQDFEAYRRAFPVFANNIVIVVEADDADRAEDGTEALYRRLQQDRYRFHHLFYPEGDPFFRRNGLLYLGTTELQAMAARLSEAQPLLSTLAHDPSIRGLFEVLGLAVDALGTADGQPDQIARVLGRITAVIEARDSDRPRSLSWKELMGGSEAADDRRRIIVLQPAELDFGSVAPAAEALKEIRRHARELGLTPENGVRVRITGSAAIDAEEIASIADNTTLSGQISFIVVALLLVLCFRSLRLVLASLVTLVVGMVWTAAFAVAAVGSFNLISVAFAVLFIGIGIDYSIHVVLRYREMVRRGEPSPFAAAGRSIGTALGLMAATSALGFFSFLPTDYRGVSELGLIAGFSMFVAFTANILVLPAALALWPLRAGAPAPQDRAAAGGIARSEHWLWRHARTIVLVAAVLGVSGLVSLWGARFDRNPLNLKDPGVESVATAIELLQNPRLRVGTISILVDTVAEIAPLAEKLRKLPSVDSVRSIYDYVPKDQPAKLDIIEEIALQMTPILAPATRLAPPDAEQRAAAISALRDKIKKALDENRAGTLAPELRRMHDALTLFLSHGTDDLRTAGLEQDLVGSLPKRLESLKAALAAKPVDFASLPESLRLRELSPAGKVRVEVVPKADLRDNRELRRFVEEVQSVAPRATGGPVVELLAGDAVVHAFGVASTLALVLISLGLLAMLRKLVDVLLILAPLLLASALTIGITVAVGLSFNFANIIVLPLLIGLGVSSGIHLVIRARRDVTIELLNTSTPRAVLYSALTTIASFASLAISSHWGQASMGLLLLIAISVNLVCYLVVLPALLAWVERSRLARVVREKQ